MQVGQIVYIKMIASGKFEEFNLRGLMGDKACVYSQKHGQMMVNKNDVKESAE